MTTIIKMQDATGRVIGYDHLPDQNDLWHRLELAALVAHQVLVCYGGACQEPLPGCPPWAHRAASILLQALDDIDDMRREHREATP